MEFGRHSGRDLLGTTLRPKRKMIIRPRLAVLSAAFAVVACHRPARTETSSSATAAMHDSAGNAVGTLHLQQTRNGVRIVGDLTGLPAGTHGIHLHQTGRCEGPAFTTAGGHFNPAARHHGLDNPAGPHAGDLPNIVVPASGRVSVRLLDERVTLDSAGTGGLFDSDGTAIVVHAAADDQRSDPAGNSGSRIACGVITKS
jgi:Cu-Zn family superoxide dismutase